MSKIPGWAAKWTCKAVEEEQNHQEDCVASRHKSKQEIPTFIMKTKFFFLTFISLTCMCLLAWGQAAGSSKNQFMLIIRSKANPQFSREIISANIKHWQEYMGSLGQSGQLSGGYRPGNEGETLSGAAKTSKKGWYEANSEVVSSFLIINASDMSAAREIASRCPVFELGGSVEIRPMRDTAK
jgi:hypothetical protein